MKKLSLLLLLFSFIVFSCKKDKDDDPGNNNNNNNNNNGSADAALVIENGSLRTAPGESVPYSAVVVDKNGTVTAATNVTWSSSNTSVVSFSSNNMSAVGVGTATITAKTTVNGKEISATVPVGVYTPSVFTVLPGVIAYWQNGDPIQLEPIYIGTGTPGTYTYSSSNSSIVSVTAGGLVSFPGAGEAVITVTATGLDGQPKVEIPVLVVGEIQVALPVVKVVVTPGVTDVFKGETVNYSAKAYNSKNEEVSASITWKISNDTVASIDATGKVTALHPGATKVQAVANGIMGEADLQIIPKTVIEITPLMASIPASKTRQFTAKTYNITKSGANYVLTLTSNPADLKWMIPTYGFAEFDIATVNQSGLVTMKSNAMLGLETVLIAYSPSDEDIQPGVGIIMVSDCDCGAGTGVTSITPSQSTINLNFMSNPSAQISATTSPSNQPLNYCSDTPSVVSVDQNGQLTAAGPGTATVTICNGNTQATITVNVSF